MADAVDIRILRSGGKRYIIHMTGISDGTGESAVVKVNLSALLTVDYPPLVPTYSSVDYVQWGIQGFSSVRLFWDHTIDDTIVLMPAGWGVADFFPVGGLVDPRSAGGTGNIILTSAGAVAGATYDITLWTRLKAVFLGNI